MWSSGFRDTIRFSCVGRPEMVSQQEVELCSCIRRFSLQHFPSDGNAFSQSVREKRTSFCCVSLGIQSTELSFSLSCQSFFSFSTSIFLFLGLPFLSLPRNILGLGGERNGRR